MDPRRSNFINNWGPSALLVPVFLTPDANRGLVIKLMCVSVCRVVAPKRLNQFILLIFI